MTKAELIKRLESLSDDTQITFALFVEHKTRGYCWQLLSVNAQFDKNPIDTIGLVTMPFYYDDIKELSNK